MLLTIMLAILWVVIGLFIIGIDSDEIAGSGGCFSLLWWLGIPLAIWIFG